MDTFYRFPWPGDRHHPFSEWIRPEQASKITQRSIPQESTSVQFDTLQETVVQNYVNDLEQHDLESSRHARRTCDLFMWFTGKLDLTGNLVFNRWGALLHDVGKLFVSREILNKPGPLNPDEWIVMRKHPDFARLLLTPIAFLQPALEIPLAHHERFDGTGYPRGLKGDEIPFPARVFSVIDVWDALRSPRSYWQAWDDQQTLAYLVEQAGRQFDPRVVDAFVTNISAAPSVS